VTASIVQSLTIERLISPPDLVLATVHYETMMGSIAYGVSTDVSDMDVNGFWRMTR
jgi:hypothetical protein